MDNSSLNRRIMEQRSPVAAKEKGTLEEWNSYQCPQAEGFTADQTRNDPTWCDQEESL